jgi:hypothetical protein
VPDTATTQAQLMAAANLTKIAGRGAGTRDSVGTRAGQQVNARCRAGCVFDGHYAPLKMWEPHWTKGSGRL